MLMLTAAISAFIAIVALSTRPRPEAQPETASNYALKIFVVAFVAIYAGMSFFGSPSGPEFDMGEPDF